MPIHHAGDLVEQHPILFDVLLIVLTAPLVEIAFLRPILGVVGFGPYGPIKGESYKFILHLAPILRD